MDHQPLPPIQYGSIQSNRSNAQQVQQLINNPDSIISTLGNSIPMTATFFITYVLVAVSH